MILLSLEIVNLHCALTLQCDKEKIRGEILNKYKENFEIAAVRVVEEDKSPSIEIPFKQLAFADFINVRIITRNSKDSKKSLSVKFVQRKNKTTAVTIILTECSPVAVAVVDFFRTLSNELAMYHFIKSDVVDKIQRCFKVLHKTKTQKANLYSKIKNLASIRNFKTLTQFGKHLGDVLFVNIGEEVALQDLARVGDFFTVLCENIHCNLIVCTQDGKTDRERIPGIHRAIGMLRLDLIPEKTPGYFTISLALSEIEKVVEEDACVESLMSLCCAPNDNAMFFPETKLSPNAVKQESQRLFQAIDSKKEEVPPQNWLNKGGKREEIPFEAEFSNLSISSCTSSSDSSSENENVKREIIAQVKQELEEDCCKTTAASGKGKRITREMKHLKEEMFAETDGFASAYPKITKEFMERNSRHVENMGQSIDLVYTTFVDISILATRLYKCLLKLKHSRYIMCTMCPLHCTEALANVNLRSAGRPPEGSCKRGTTKRPAKRARLHVPRGN